MVSEGSNGNARPSSEPHSPTHRRIGVPELGGVCTYAEAARPGLNVEENVALLKRYNWVECRLTDLMLTRITATPEWEVKDALCLHVWLDSEHAKWLQERVAELRHPPHNFHTPPDAGLEAFLQEALRSEGTVELLVALYTVIKPALLDAYRTHREITNPLVDQPTGRFLRFIIQEEEEMIAWGREALNALLVDDNAREAARRWETHLRAYLDAAGGIADGGRRTEDEGRRAEDEKPGSGLGVRGADAGARENAEGARGRGAELPPARAAAPFVPDFTPRRDSRFQSFNYNFPPHWVYAQEDRPARERMLALVCKRLLEMDVPEMMAAIIWRAREESLKAGRPRPWDYTAEMCRQVWDEARHSMMGEVWLANRGIDFTRVPLNVGFSLGLNRLATAQEAHAALYWIEQGLMPKSTGKAYEWRIACESGDALASLFMDYDWADEVLHVHIGHWLVEELGSREEAERIGSEAFARVMAIRRQRGLEGAKETEQSEWWPEFCEDVIGLRPEPLAPELYETPDQDAPWLKNA